MDQSKIVARLRERMIEMGLAAYIVPSFDAHQSEYVSDYFKVRQWLTGFTGSAGTAVVTLDKALLWTDGRYHTQALTELKGSSFELIKQGLPGEPSVSEWLNTHLQEGATIGFDGTCTSQGVFEQWQRDTSTKGLTFKYESCLLEPLWIDRPNFPKEPVMNFPIRYAGEARTQKIERVREIMGTHTAQGYIIPNLDDIAWLLNIRGGDITFCPFVIAYVAITMEDVLLFIHEEKLNSALVEELERDGIKLLPYESVFTSIKEMKEKTFLCDLNQVSAKLFASLPNGSKVVGKGDVVTRMKAHKSDAELKNIRNSQLKDGAALVEFLNWLEGAVAGGGITEVDIAHKLVEFRSKQEGFMGPSFNTIAGYGSNAAMMHYSATKENHSVLEPKGFVLVDSGGQYLDGTTDITRTIALGPLSEEERRDYTLTLKAHIGLSKAIFLKGTCGPHLDILARKPMWEAGLDYKCGTGHGLGYFLSVHEGPHTLRMNQNDTPLEKGMLITNEPGVYKPGRHGIRIENTVLVTDYCETEFGTFYQFETISYCPIDKAPLVMELLTQEEIEWLNNYHSIVREVLLPLVAEELKEKLVHWTSPVYK